MYQVKMLKKTGPIPWKQIPTAHLDHWKWEQTDRWPTEAQLVYLENEGFLCRMRCEQSDPWALRENDGEVWLDSALEVFISMDGVGYINVEVNASGAFLACFGTSRDDRISVREGIRVEVSRTEKDWVALIHLPLSVIHRCFPVLELGSLRSGFAFRGNFYKMGENPETGKFHYAMWNEVMTPTPDFHRPEYFGEWILA